MSTLLKRCFFVLTIVINLILLAWTLVLVPTLAIELHQFIILIDKRLAILRFVLNGEFHARAAFVG